MRTKRKIAIIRGPSLSKWEMQIYEPLSSHFSLLGIGSKPQFNDTRNIKFPCVFLPLRFGFAQKLPKYIVLMNALFGDTRWLGNFDKTIAGYDILHTVELRTGFTLQAVRAKRKGLVKSVTVTVYENIPFVGDEFPARLRLKELALPYIDHFFAANEEAQEALLAEGVETSKISIVPQSVETVRFVQKERKLQTLQKHFALRKEDFVVLSVGRMVWEKGWYDVVRAAHRIRSFDKTQDKNTKFEIRNNKKIVFLCVGDGPERKKLIQLIKRLEIQDTIFFPGNIEYQHMPDIFRMADIFVLASLPTRIWNEQFGGVLIEAMASALPIVGTTNGGIRSTVGDSGGIFVPPQDFAKLADAILHLYKNPDLAQKMGKHNREVSQKLYDARVVVRKIDKIWSRLI